MMKMGTKIMAAATVAIAGLAAGAPADAYTVGVVEASGAGQFNAVYASAATLLAQPDASYATFTYSGPLSFSNTGAQNSTNTGDLTSDFFGANAAFISSYSGSGPSSVAYGAGGANYNSLAGFLATSGSVNGYGYGSLYGFQSDTGIYDGLVLTITHDDGVSVYVNGDYTTALAGTTAGPTSAITESVVLPTGTTYYTIVYGRENGSPSILNVAAVPEPASWAMMIGGFGLVGGALRRRRAVAAIA